MFDLKKLLFLEEKINTKPYPHIYSEHFFSESFFNDLDQSFPNSEFYKNIAFQQGGRQDLGRWRKEFYEFINSSKEWREFYEFTQSQDFIKLLFNKFEKQLKSNDIEILNWKFSSSILGYEGPIKSRFKKLIHFFKISDLLNLIFGKSYSVSFSINRACSGYSSPPHIDTRHKIIVILIYFNEFSENQNQGKLDIYDQISVDELSNDNLKDGFAKNDVHLEKVKSIKTKSNSGIVFINNRRAWHGVDEIDNDTNGQRRFVYISIADSKLKNAWK
jgi:hypothetical protein